MSACNWSLTLRISWLRTLSMLFATSGLVPWWCRWLVQDISCSAQCRQSGIITFINFQDKQVMTSRLIRMTVPNNGHVQGIAETFKRLIWHWSHEKSIYTSPRRQSPRRNVSQSQCPTAPVVAKWTLATFNHDLFDLHTEVHAMKKNLSQLSTLCQPRSVRLLSPSQSSWQIAIEAQRRTQV